MNSKALPKKWSPSLTMIVASMLAWPAVNGLVTRTDRRAALSPLSLLVACRELDNLMITCRKR